MHLREFQSRVSAIYGARDRERGQDGTFRWLVEEVGELARALRDGSPESLREEGFPARARAHRQPDNCSLWILCTCPYLPSR